MKEFEDNSTLMYIHGYASSGNAYKAKMLQQMFPSCKVVSPTLDYNKLLPEDIQQTLRRLIEENDVRLIVGSSFGGYHALCATQFFEGPVWCVNPVRDVVATIQGLLMRGVDERFVAERTGGAQSAQMADGERMIAAYSAFDERVFKHLPRRDRQLSFALSTDDEVLGDHRPLLQLFPNTDTVIWRDNARHRFYYFNELHDAIAATMR